MKMDPIMNMSFKKEVNRNAMKAAKLIAKGKPSATI